MNASARKEKIDGVILTLGIQLGYSHLRVQQRLAVLYDENWQPKVSVFGLPKAFDNLYNTRQIMAEGSRIETVIE